jgi:CBS domain-containing protein
LASSATGVLSVDPETELGEVVDLMIEHRIGAVRSSREGRTSSWGIVSYVDVLRAAKDEL